MFLGNLLHLAVSDVDFLGGVDDRLEAGPAEAVHGQGRTVDRDSTPEEHVPRDVRCVRGGALVFFQLS
jgi:hypothetical protein